MILQALVKEYENLEQQGKLERPGWSPVKVSLAMILDEEGNLLEIEPRNERKVILGKNGKEKEIWNPQVMKLPTPVKKSSGIVSNFLYENGEYLLGIDTKGKPERALKCFTAAKKIHKQLLGELDCIEAKAICRFFDQWDPAAAMENEEVIDSWEELQKGGNLVFSFFSGDAQDVPEIRQAWQEYYDQADAGAPIGQCLVTGKEAPVAILHPNLQGIRGAKSTGAALVSFNARAYESYGCVDAQGLNAPVSRYAAFAYGAALNYLLADKDRVQAIGDTTVVCWAENGDTAYQDISSLGLSADDAVRDVIKKLAKGEKVDWNGISVSPDERFYVLGLSPNAARASVRFFWQNSFGVFAENLQKHFDRLEIYDAGSFGGKLSIWGLLQETINKKALNAKPSPQLAGDMLRSILSGDRYPENLLSALELRVRADHEMKWRRAAIIKAFLLNNCSQNKFTAEAATVKVNEETTYTPYVLGRIFARYEAIQQRTANGSLNATIRDRYFNSAAATPASVFAVLGKLCQSHLRKLDRGAKIYQENELSHLFGMLKETIPARLSLQDQAVFQLGYYHEVQKIYTKKGDKENE